ncbi:hypothetical protein ACHAW6_009990 [Cyclotella cf. meneghiniana]
MEIPYRIETTKGNTKDYVLQLPANICSQKQAGRVWNQYLVRKLESIGFAQSQINECVFYRKDVIFTVYVDDGIFLGLRPSNQGSRTSSCLHWIGSYLLSQRTLIESIIADVGLTPKDFTKPVPAKCTLRLHASLDSPPFQEEWNHRSAVGKLNYLGQTSRSDILYTIHIVAKYSSNPRQEHGQAIIYISGLHFKLDPSKGLYCYANADFSGEWNKDFAEHELVQPSQRGVGSFCMQTVR